MEAQPRYTQRLPQHQHNVLMNNDADNNSPCSPSLINNNMNNNKLINIDDYSCVSSDLNKKYPVLRPQSIFNTRMESLLQEKKEQCNDDMQHLLELNSVETRLPLYNATVDHQPISVLIDSGATENYVSPNIVQHVDHFTPVTNRQVETAGGEVIEINHKVTIDINLNGHNDQITAYVFPNKFGLILGRSWLKSSNATPDWNTDVWTLNHNGQTTQLRPINTSYHHDVTHLNYLISHKQADRLIKKHHADSYLIYIKDHYTNMDTLELNSISPSDKDTYWNDLVKQYADVFKDELPGLPPERNVQHVINTEDAKPISRAPFKMSPAELDELQKQLKQLLSLGLIRPSTSPWGAPVLFVKKKNGEMRMCIDYRALNKVTVKNKHPLPRIDECLDRLQGSSYFTSLDLKSGYHQVRIHPNDVPKTAFNTRYGQYEFLVLPFGLTNAPPTFQSLMNSVLGDCLDKFALVYLDDILIYSNNEQEHKQHVKHVLGLLRKAKLIGNLKKCEFGKRELVFVGYKITSQGILPDPSKVNSIKNWPVLTNVQEVRSFIGLAQYYRRFMPNFAAIASPLTDLTRGTGPKKRSINWTKECQESFDKIKTLLTSAPVLELPNMAKPFRIETDASDYGVGAVLLQPGDNGDEQWHPVAYESKKLSNAERNYPAQERELLGIIHALRTWRCFVDGCTGGYTVYSDHMPLKYFRSQEKPTPRLVRWMTELESFAPNIQYTPGKNNDVPDALSRLPSTDTTNNNEKPLEPIYLYTASLQSKSSKWSSEDMKADWPLMYLGDPNTIARLKNIALKEHLEKEKANFVVDGNKVYRKVSIGENNTVKLVPFVPLASRGETVAGFHEAFGHFNYPNMMKVLSPRAWWPSMRSDIKEWLAVCPQCQVNKRRGNFHHDVMHPLKVPSAFERWHIDFIGELPTTLKGNRWILVAVDYATNWPIARALPVASTEAVADFLYEEIMMKFGCPVEILTDRGANFTSGLLKAYSKRVKMNHKLTSAYHPRANAKVERFNGVLKDMLRKYTNGAIHRWDDFVNAALWACRIRVHATTGYSPFFLTYGREPRIPGDIAVPYISKDNLKDPRTIADITSRELADLGQHRAAAEFRMKAMAESDKERWDSKIKKKSYEVGDMVMLTHEGRFGLEPRFKGPFVVVQVFPDYGTVKLQTVSGEPLKSLAHVDRLLAAKGDVPSEPWYDPTSARRNMNELMRHVNMI